MNINTSSYWSASSATSNGLSGLVSGMDTESMVEQLLSGTQSKIDAAKGEQQVTTWKQEMYRDVITAINEFKNKYFNSSFDASSVNNFASSGFFNDMTASLISGSGLKVISADSSALTGEMKVKIDQLASAAKITTHSNQKISTNQVTGEKFDLDSLKESLKNTVTINTSDGDKIEVDLTGATTQQQVLDKLNAALSDKGITDITAKAGKVGTTISFEVKKDAATTIDSIETTDLAGQLTGLSGYNTSTDDDGNTVVNASAEMNLNAYPSFDVSFDGVNKTIILDNIDVTQLTDVDALSKVINDKLGKAFGVTANGAVIQTKVENGALKFTFADGYDTSGHSFRLTGADLNDLGITPGSSSHVSTATKLSDLQGVSGGVYEFTINGETFKFTSDQTVSDVINQVNASGAGVKLSYSSLADQFVLESASTGANYNITMSQQTGNLLGAMFGNDIVEAGTSAVGDRLTTGTIAGSAIGSEKVQEAVIEFTVNGQAYSFSLPKQTDENATGYTADEFATKFNEFLTSNFGEDSIVYNKDSGALEIAAGFEVEITSESVLNASGNGKIDLGLEGKNNLATASTALKDIVNLSDADRQALGGDNVTLGTLNGANGVTFESDGRLHVASGATVQLENVVIGNGGDFSTNGTLTDDQKKFVTSGTDAIVNINGVQTTRSSNTFTIDGVTMQLTGVTQGDEAAVIGTERNVDTIVEAFENFVNDYNALLDKLYGYTDQDAEYRDYPPLTSAQKEEMSENEIELWEEKAKTGLLRNDSSITNFLSQMRTAMYERPAGCAVALYDIGIETGEYTEKGKLHLDTAKLRSALASDPSSIEQLFLDVEEGLSGKLQDAMKAAANPSSGSPGVLVELAGVKGYASESNNSLTQELSELKERIEQLQAQYDKEKERYWSQFNSMEQILANFNSQSAMISSQFSGY